MKTDLSVMDIHFLVPELRSLIGGKIDQIYQKGKEEFIFQVHIPNVGKKIVRILPGKLIYVASAKGQMPEKPPGFCLYLRKYLKSGRIRDIKQVGFERILEIDLDTKEQKYKLIIELFSKGNLVVCDESYLIYSAMESQVVSGRTIKPKMNYTFPKNDYDLFTLTEIQLKTLCKESEKESIVKTLAIDLRLGGIYSEELCLLSGIDKQTPSNKLADKELKSLFKSINVLITEKLQPKQVFKDAKLIDILPIKLDYYADYDTKPFDSFNDALDEFFTQHEAKKQKDVITKKITTKLDKIHVMIEEQEKRIKGLERSISDNQRKGELVFEHYTELQELLSKITELKKKHSWKEINELLKDNTLVKNIDEKTGDITVEV